LRRVLALAAAITAITGGCGIGGGGNLQQIGSEDLAGLDQTTTSSTTTTSTTTVPIDTAVGTTTSAATTSTIATEPVELYYVSGDVLESVTQDVFRDISLFGVLRALESGPPPPDVAVGLTSVVPIGLIRGVTEAGTGVAAVDLSGDIFEDIAGDEQRQAIAQIVLTLTRRPGIGQVRFTLDGEDLQIPKRGNVLSEPGEPVSRLDYESLLAQDQVSPTEPPTTVTPTSTQTTPEPTGRGSPTTAKEVGQ
jgi:spore germination protein GerM